MRTPKMAVLSLLLVAPLSSAEPMCGTSPENDARIRAVHARTREWQVRTHAEPQRTVTLRDGAMYLRNDATITPGYRAFDMEGQTLIFTPTAAGFTASREPLQYVEPPPEPVREFQGATGPSWFSVTRDLGFSFPFRGRNVTRIYVTAFNSIHFDPPIEQTGGQFDAVETAVHRSAVVSPLMITSRKPRYLEFPRVFIDERADAVVVTWRSTGNAPFGYDVQAELRSDGTIAYAYREVTAMRWGTPVISTGFDPVTVTRTSLAAINDSANDVISQVAAAVRPMFDIRHVEVMRLGGSDLFGIRVRLATPIDPSKLGAGETLGFQATIGVETAVVEITRGAVSVAAFTGNRAEVNGATARLAGDTLEIYGMQREPELRVDRSLRVASYQRPLNRIVDSSVIGIPFTPAPRVLATDLSTLTGATELALPIAEPFALGAFDPYAVWEELQRSYGVNDHDYDGVAMYQTYFTDIIFFAGAYATGGNPKVDGIAAPQPGFGYSEPREVTLLHMNQLEYNYSAAEMSASKVMLHEFGHRWLYFISIAENGQNTRSLNPLSAHPAAYVHTPAAFPVYGPDESSVMGGGFFTPQNDGTYRAHAANQGYSWTDLYLMGLADPEEVPPWFYLAGTTLPGAYWPEEGSVVNGQRRDVAVSQVTTALGPRLPTTALSQRVFKVLFVLVTEEDRDPTDAEVAKLNEWRALMERNFAIATGGRARLSTSFARPDKRRAVR